MKISIEFQHTKSKSVGTIVDAATGRLVLSYEIDFANVSHRKRRLYRLGSLSAGDEMARNLHPCVRRYFKGNGLAFRAAPDFEREFLGLVQGHMLDQAAQRGIVIVPTNYLEEIWTQQHIKALARRLSQKRSIRFLRQRQLEYILVRDWESKALCKMDRHEVARWVNVYFVGNPFKPAAVWQCAYRIGLLSEREKGPKPRGPRP